MWGTDMTATFTRQEGQVAIFIAVDHCSAECVGIHAAKQGTRFEALEPIRQGVRTSFGAFGQDIAQGLVLRHDHGSQYMSHVFQEELTIFGYHQFARLCPRTRRQRLCGTLHPDTEGESVMAHRPLIPWKNSAWRCTSFSVNTMRPG